METATRHDLGELAAQFQVQGNYVSHRRYGSGHINDTYELCFAQQSKAQRYIFQRINVNVFKDPAALMFNIERVCAHAAAKLRAEHCADLARRTLSLVPTVDGRSFYRNSRGEYWRVYEFIANASTYEVVATPRLAYETASAFGAFQKLLADLPGAALVESIPNFHHTPVRYQALLSAIEADACNRVKDVRSEIAFFAGHEQELGRLVEGLAAGELPLRVVHNDTKLSNVLIDNASQQAICVVDLDTVMPGLSLYDFGDMVRAATCPTPEDEQDLSKVVMHMPLFRELARGYITAIGDVLTRAEKELLVFAGKLITLETGMRFLTDYLQGDVYFKTGWPEHNLIRCRTQIQLVRSIERQFDEMNRLLASLS